MNSEEKKKNSHVVGDFLMKVQKKVNSNYSKVNSVPSMRGSIVKHITMVNFEEANTHVF